MVEQQALVVAVEQQHARVEIVRQKPCGICGQTRGCGVSIWGKLFGHQTGSFPIQNSLQAKVGDYVLIGVEDGAVMSSATHAYGIPLILMLIGAALATMFMHVSQNIDINTLLGALLGFAIGYAWLQIRVRRFAIRMGFEPRMLQLLAVPPSSCR
jgi:sigma-E factor negative regulatory protein RseC